MKTYGAHRYLEGNRAEYSRNGPYYYTVLLLYYYVIHQPGDSKDGSEMAAGNNEVDKLVKLRRIAVIREVDNNIIEKIHDQTRHPSVNLMGKILSDKIHIPNWRKKYQDILKKM